jgi:hypothetical protein
MEKIQTCEFNKGRKKKIIGEISIKLFRHSKLGKDS